MRFPVPTPGARRGPGLPYPLPHLLAVLLLAAALALPAGAADETAGPSTEGQTEQPCAEGAETAVSGEPCPPTFSGRVEVTAERSKTLESTEHAIARLATVPGGVDVIDAESYKSGRTSTLQDALGYSPGVVIQNRFGAEEARLSIRGSGLQRTFHGRGLELMQDGVPLNLADGSFDFQAVEPLAARHVEVYRGANGLEHGASTLGGAVNFVSRAGFDAAPWQARLEGGSFGYLRAQASLAGDPAGADWFATLTHFSQEGFRDHAEQGTQRLFANLGLDLGAGRESRFFVAAVRTRSELPGSLTRAQLAADPSAAAGGSVALDQRRDFDLVRVSNRTAFDLGDSGELEFSGFYSYKDLFHPIFQHFEQRSHDVGAEARWQRTLAAGGRLVVGLAPAVGWLDDERFRNLGGEKGDPTAAGATRSGNVDLYGEIEWPLTERWRLTGGLVASWADRRFDDGFLVNGDQSDRDEYTALSPKLGLLWQATPEASLFATAARSFEPPTFGELVNVGGDGLLDLEAQTATTVEVGSRGTVTGSTGAWRWDVVLYRSELRDELLSLTDGQGNPLGTINAGSTTHEGAEVGFSAALGGSGGAAPFGLRFAYTWGRFRFDDDPTFGGNRLAGLPEHLLHAEVELRFAARRFGDGGSDGWYLAPNVEWAPQEYPVDHANTLYADGYTTVGLKLGRRAAGGWSWFIEGRNLTDRRYAATTGVVADAAGADLALFFPGDGRSVYVGFEVKPGG